jgi:hypothetical protein
MLMRAHQKQITDIASQISTGIWDNRRVVLDCTPGGGKTASATILLNRLIDAGIVDCGLWLVPRLSLAEQVIDAFSHGVGACSGRTLTQVDRHDNLFAPSIPGMPCLAGHVTTYQAVCSTSKSAKRFRDAVASRRCLIIPDEVQFLSSKLSGEDGFRSGWYSKMKDVAAAANFMLIMSGTLWRTDGDEIPFIEYVRRDDGLRYPKWDIQYSLRDAVAEQAVLPIEWQKMAGTVEYDYKGERHCHSLLDNDPGLVEENSRIVRTFLSGEKVVASVIDRMVEDWRSWCRTGYQSRMIVMADTVKDAKRIFKYLESHHNISCVLATSKEEAAGRQLRHFRERRKGQCLVTVAMAYVGFDCPDLSHLAYLSSIRSPAWMLQSFARVSRFDRSAPVDYAHQHAFVYGPDDRIFRDFNVWLRYQQEMGLADRRTRFSDKPNASTIAVPEDFDPIKVELGGKAIESLQRRIDPSTAAWLDTIAAKSPAAASLPRSKLFEILLAIGTPIPGSKEEPPHARAG